MIYYIETIIIHNPLLGWVNSVDILAFCRVRFVEILCASSNRLKIALKNAANAIDNLKDTELSNFFARISHRKGRVSAIAATARKLGLIIWNMVVKGNAYIPLTEYQFVDQKGKKIGAMKRLITKFKITTNDLSLQV